jgi:hypothetical protein
MFSRSKITQNHGSQWNVSRNYQGWTSRRTDMAPLFIAKEAGFSKMKV